VLALLVTLSVILLSASLGSSSGGPLGSVQSGFLDIFAPIQDGVSTLLTPVRDVVNDIDDVVNAVGERNRYHAENQRLLAQNAQLQADRRQYLALSKLFTLDAELGVSSYKQVTAQIADESPNIWYSHVMIDAGSGAGVRVGDVVIDGDGLVGRVSTVATDAAEVTLLTDATSAVAARDARTGTWGIVEPAAGSTSQLLFEFPTSTSLSPGDLIVTAGTTSAGRSAFPANIPIGRVTSIDSAATTISLAPNANVRQLEDVQVLTSLKPLAHLAGAGTPTASVRGAG
jgi:rod shape-determining protein MreC